MYCSKATWKNNNFFALQMFKLRIEKTVDRLFLQCEKFGSFPQTISIVIDKTKDKSVLMNQKRIILSLSRYLSWFMFR